MALAKKVVNQAGAMREFEKPEVCKAIKVANANRWTVALSPTEWDERKARLKKEFEERSNAPVPGKEQQEEKIRIICCSASPKADFYYKHVLNEGNPALKESATQFNDALLDEQAKEIKSLVKDITHMDNVIYKKNLEIDKQNQEITRLLSLVEKKEGYNLKQIKRLGKEIARLNKIIHEKKKVCCELVAENTDLKERLTDKDAVLSDVAEELRLSKIREKNLTEVSQKYMKENEELKATKKEINDIARGKTKVVGVDIAEEGGDHSAIIAQCCKNIAISKDEAEIIERCTKNGTELHYSEKDGFTYTNMFGDEMPIICLRGIFHVFTEEELKNMKK